MNTEKGAQAILITVGMSSIFAFVVAITLGLRGDQGVAALFLIFALADSVVAWIAYRRYTALRHERWQRELKGSEEELGRMFENDEGRKTEAQEQ